MLARSTPRHALPAHLLLTFGLILGTGALQPAQSQYLEIKVRANDGDERDRLGESAAIDGTTALVGAFRDDDAGFDAGAAYIFQFDGSEWLQEDKLIPFGPPFDGDPLVSDLFGSAVALSGSVAVVGAPEARPRGQLSGAAYVFERVGPGNWVQTARLTAFDATEGDKFGASVATNGDYLMIGALDDDDRGINSGSVYVYSRSNNGWTLSEKLFAADGVQGDSFGWYVAMDGDRAVVGARDVDAGAANTGAAYVFERKENSWVETARLVASDRAADDSFGEVVDIDGNRIAIGARDVAEGTGAAYVFDWSPAGWVEAARLTASDGIAGDLYGHAVAVSGDRVFVTTRNDNDRRGAAYLYERIEGVWQETTKLAPDDLETDDQYGQAVSMGERYAIITSKHDDDGALDAGAAYFYDLQNTDRGALLALYDATNGPDWTNNNAWATSTALGTWDGVTTDAEGFVTHLILPNNGLQGSLPAAIGTFDRIEVLELNDNALSGPLQPALGDLSSLVTLRLFGNAFAGVLPDALGQLANLEILALGANDFTGSIPEAFGGMTRLRELYIPDNQLEGVVPDALAALPDLEILRVQFNALTALPDFSAAADRMTSLRAHTNRFTFEDLEPNVGISGFEYIPQADFGTATTISIDEGEALTIDIPIGGAENRYVWRKDGIAIDDATSRVFSRVAATTADAGVYTLQVTNALVTGLTLTSRPVTVVVSNAERFDANLRSVNVLPPFFSPSSGELTAALTDSRMVVTGSFKDLTNPFNGASLYIGNPNANGIQVGTLTATLSGSGGVFEAERNSFTLSASQVEALRAGRLYSVIFTTRTDAQSAVQEEMRGHFYLRPNEPPPSAVLTAPANGTTVDLANAGTLTVTWTADPDPDGHPTAFLWAFSREASFASVDGLFRTEQTPSFSISHATLDAFLASRGVAPGETTTLFHGVAVTDGSLVSLSEPRSISLKRSVNNTPPFVRSAIADRVQLVGSPAERIALATVFSDPETDLLTFSAQSDAPDVAGLAIDQDTLVVTPGAIGRAQITVSAMDPRGGTTQDVFTFTVNAAPQVVVAIPDQALVEGGEAFSTALTGVFTDADPLSYTVGSSNSGVAMAEIDGVTLRVTPGAPGTSRITVTATDDKRAGVSTAFTVTVQEDRITPPQSVAETVSLTFGDPTRSTSYRLVGLPGQVSLPMAQAVPGVLDVDWVAYRDRGDPDLEDDEAFQKYDGSAQFDFRPGRGFWLLSKQAWARSDTRTTVALDAQNEYAIPLQNGWNIISNPFDIDLRWSDIQTRNGIDESLFAWNGAFSGATILASARSGQAYYFLNADSLSTLALPYVPAGVAGQTPPRGLSLTVRPGDGPPSQVVAGVSDAYADQPAPPRGFESTSLRLLRGASTGAATRSRELIEAYEPVNQEGYRFDLSLQSEAGTPLTLHAEDTRLFAGQRIALVDPRLGRRYDLDVEPTVSFNTGAGQTAWVLLIGSDAYIEAEVRAMAPAGVVLTQNYPNPFSSGTIIEYALPEPTRVRMVVYDALGRLVQVLVDGARDAGFHSIRWDLTGGASFPVRSGLYMYRLEAGDVHIVRSMTVVR